MSFVRTSALLIAIGALAGDGLGQTTHQVFTQSLSFSPANITIDAGDSVMWNWTGGNLHTATEGTDDTIDPTDAFSYILDSFNPTATHLFDTKFLFEHPRPGHFYPYVCVPHAQFGMTGSIQVNSPWTNLGSAKGGVLGEALLYGAGPLTSGSSGQILLENAPSNALTVLFAGLVQGNAPFKGGTLVPVPILLQIDLTSDASGNLALPFVAPTGLAGVPIYFQCALADASATLGVGLSNAMEALFQ